MAFRKSASKDRQSRLPVSLRSVVDKQSPLAIINSLHWTVAKGQPVPSPAYRSGGILGSMLDKFAAKNPHACVWDESRFSLN